MLLCFGKSSQKRTRISYPSAALVKYTTCKTLDFPFSTFLLPLARCSGRWSVLEDANI